MEAVQGPVRTSAVSPALPKVLCGLRERGRLAPGPNGSTVLLEDGFGSIYERARRRCPPGGRCIPAATAKGGNPATNADQMARNH